MKRILVTAILTQFLLTSLSFAASLKSINTRLNNLEDELIIAQEENIDLKREFDNSMKLSGYTDIEYISQTSQNPGFRLHHFSLFFEKKLTDNLHFFSEIEFEDAPKFEHDGSDTLTKKFGAANGKIFLEAVNISYLLNSKANFRLGRFFTPAGLWSIDHYPPFVPTQERPQHIRAIFPQLVDGAMAYGSLPVLGETFLNYDVYLGNGEGNTAHNDENSSKAFGVKASFLLPYLNHFEIGSTYYTDILNPDKLNARKTASGVHAKIKASDLTLQIEYATGKTVDDAATVTNSKGYYLQALYDIGKYTVGLRHDFYDDDTKSGNVSDKKGTINGLFINYHVNEHVVIKLEQHLVNIEDPTKSDYNKTLLSVVAYLGN